MNFIASFTKNLWFAMCDLSYSINTGFMMITRYKHTYTNRNHAKWLLNNKPYSCIHDRDWVLGIQAITPIIISCMRAETQKISTFMNKKFFTTSVHNILIWNEDLLIEQHIYKPIYINKIKLYLNIKFLMFMQV